MKLNPRAKLAVDHIGDRATNRDWSEGYDEAWDIVFPAVTLDVIREREPDLIEGRWPKLTPELIEAFEQTRSHDDWRASFEPMMNHAWPVKLFNVSADDAADLMNAWAPVCTLIDERAGEGYSIALSAGGMDLSDALAAAYICCGCVPPLRILEDLSGVISKPFARKIGLRRAYRATREWLAWRLKDIRREELRIFAKPKPA